MSWQNNELFAVLEETRSKLLLKERELDEQLKYVIELEEAVQTLAEKVEMQSSQITERDTLILKLSNANRSAELEWREKMKSAESSFSVKLGALISKLETMTKENDELIDHIDALEDKINDQQTVILDLEAHLTSIQISSASKNFDDPHEGEVHFEQTEELDTSVLSLGSDEEHSPSDIKISRDLSSKNSAHRRSSFASLTQGVDASFMHLRPASVMSRTDELPTSSLQDDKSLPPMPPTVYSSRTQSIDVKERNLVSYEDVSKIKEPSPPPKSEWQHRKKHEDLFRPVTNDKSDQLSSTYQWYIKGNDARRKYKATDGG